MSKRLTTEQRLTPAQLEAIRKRAEKATEGPWEFDGVGYCGEYPYIIDLTVGEVGVRYHAEDAEFISKARTDIPALLSEVERLREGINRAMYALSNEDTYDTDVINEIHGDLIYLYDGSEPE